MVKLILLIPLFLLSCSSINKEVLQINDLHSHEVTQNAEIL